MTAVLTQLRQQTRRRHRRADPSRQRLDIQGLRMVAVLTVIGFHLCGWPRGGFVGVDVFFVISGFLITGNLLKMAESRGQVSFKRFYWNRVRRIIPAATVVLALTCVVTGLVFRPFRAHEVAVDAFYAFIFMSNWWFAAEKTDYFAGAASASPIQHYWSLSVEEQFYFVWPALVFLIGLVVARRAWPHARRMGLAGVVMGTVIGLSLLWALYETATWPTRAYFDTLARVWELGVGALLATAIGLLARIPTATKPWLSWAGLGLITASVFLINDKSPDFPAPWALLPVVGASLVIAAGVRGEPAQWVLRNRASVYVGNISYSLYLVHWPVIVVLGALLARGIYFYVIAVALTFGIAIASFHFVENPLRYTDWGKARDAIHHIRRGRFRPRRSSQYAAAASLTLLTLALTAYAMRPVTYHQQPAPPAASSEPVAQSGSMGPRVGPLESALQVEINAALTATQWPELNPPMDSVISSSTWWPAEIAHCAITTPEPPNDQDCTWGSASAATRITLVGDSIAVSYATPLRELALNSNGAIQMHIEAMPGCSFSSETMFSENQQSIDACPARRQHAVDYINASQPNVVIISNSYQALRRVGDEKPMTQTDWFDSVHQIVDKISTSTAKLVWLSAPPPDKNLSDCYGKQSSIPSDCISYVTNQWQMRARTDQRLAQSFNGIWVDSLPWFCLHGYCPSFVGTTPTKKDQAHITPEYGQKIYPVMGEAFRALGIL